MSSANKKMDGDKKRRRKKSTLKASDNSCAEPIVDRPFFTNNLDYYPELPKPSGPKKDSFKYYKDWKSYSESVQVEPEETTQLSKERPQSSGADPQGQSIDGNVKDLASNVFSLKDYKGGKCYIDTAEVEPGKPKQLGKELLEPESIGAAAQSQSIGGSAKNLGYYSELQQPIGSTVDALKYYKGGRSYSETVQVEPEKTTQLGKERPQSEPLPIAADLQSESIDGSVKNLGYYSELQQPIGSSVDSLKYYRDCKGYYETVQAEPEKTTYELPKPEPQPIGANPQRRSVDGIAHTCQLLGEKVYAWTHQPNGQPLVSLPALAAMDGVNLASVLMAAHLIQNRQDPGESCMMTHFNANELRSYFVQSDEVRHVLNRCERRELNLHKAVPLMCPPMARDLPQPPSQWLAQPKTKPKHKKRLPQSRQGVDARGLDNFVKPNLKLIAEWQPETSSYNYKLQSPHI
ncbi:PREDICTED: uncharacterized protein LOC108619390 [Drosophila arizonae]|uniref:Uncharacterized protein LOC108619390 n=1 Tax=Drosophila arizonae TaxID=7263 RepID=A0ABM1PW58_DROAR|nr:PREDICTED: uncharacterized protein LOC108619390 [Drosophila arizonae]